MEKRSWNNKSISLNKSLLSVEELEVNLNSEEIKDLVKNNEKEARELLFSFPGLDKDVVSFFEVNTLMDGSVDISNVDLISPLFKKEGMCFSDGKKITTRGYNYICSLDASLTSTQKIKKYQEIIYLTIESLQNEGISKVEKLLILDYLKNNLITILNSLIYQEKLSLENLDTSKEYETDRTELISSLESVIDSSLDLMLNKDLSSIKGINFKDLLSCVDNTVEKLIGYYSTYRLPGSYVSRPEVTHPLIIMGASLLCSERYKNVDTVVGVPSGGTEFAVTVKVFINKLHNSFTELVLLPVSLHSAKQFTDNNNDNEATQAIIKKYLGKYTQSVLICDDNTSTGRTLQLLKDSILSLYPDTKIHCAVAEADVIRSQIDRDSSKRTHVANKDIYVDAVNFLPISKNINPKTDLREIIEKRKIISYYKDMQEKSSDLVDQIYAKVMARVNDKGTDYSSFTEENSVAVFRGTFLSNFYAVPVVLDGKTYPTVEHAYQAAKFFPLDWSLVKQEAKNEIEETLKLRGYAAPVVYSGELFTDEKMTAGNIKVISEILQKHGCVDEEWKDRRIKIMIDLLMQKFNTEEMKIKLKKTGEKELIEGNDWNDTLWGVCEGRGRNILGSILMEIRKLDMNE